RHTDGRACGTCHARKVKCDILETGSPCTHCRNHKKTDCLLFEKKKTRTSLVQRSRRGDVPLEPRTEPSTPRDSRWADPSTSSVPTPSSPPEHEHDARNLADFLDREDVRTSEINVTGRLYFIGTEFSNLNYLVRQRSRKSAQNVLHFGSHPFAPRMPSSVPQEALQLPTKALADELIQAYFTHINPGFPVVDEDEFMKSYNGLPNQEPRRQLGLLLLNSIFVVGAHVLAAKNPEMLTLKHLFYRRAKSIMDCRFEQHREVYIQSALLMTWVCYDLEDIVSNSWHLVGVATRTAFGMGIHRDPTPANLNAMDKRQWMRLWWILFQYDVMVSVAQGRPQAMQVASSSSIFKAWHFIGITNPEVDFFICHTQLCVIFSRVMKKRLAIRASAADRADATREADEALAAFITSLPEPLQLPATGMNTWQATLHLTYNNFLILLHRPPPHSSGDPSLDTASDLSICADAAAAIANIFDAMRAQESLSKLWMASIYTLFTALVHLSSQVASPNPLVVARSKRLYSSLVLSLREMSTRWLYAKSLLRLFDRGVGQDGPRTPSHNGADASTARDGGDGAGFTLRPSAPEMGTGAAVGDGPGMVPPHMSQDLQPYGMGSAYAMPGTSQGMTTSNPPEVDALFGAFGDPALGFSADGSDMTMLPALEVLLAGIGADFDFDPSMGSASL
ncbi:fungal-specific transcription factor domain-containing protein, partial [Plectosphaerella plurivora]